tara:strand:+ start:876 stop:1832 length:957 start_codon:yes stop_codon:yes gene_type:complete
MKILINDGLHAGAVDSLRSQGFEVDTDKRSTESDLVRAVTDTDFAGLIVRSATQVTRNVLEAGAGKLRIVGRAGAGVDNVDLDAATRYGTLVKNAPDGNVNAVGELVFGMMLVHARNLLRADGSIREGRWDKALLGGSELAGKTLGVIGCGRIGENVARKARAFGMSVLGYDLERRAGFPGTYVEKGILLQASDYVTIHTGGKDVILDWDDLIKMRETAVVVNASRGGNIDPDALYEALSRQRIGGALLDVYGSEPQGTTDFRTRFAEFPNVVLTPHLGAATDEAQFRTGQQVVNGVVNYLRSGDRTNALNTLADRAA